jgi:hypothetical protein
LGRSGTGEEFARGGSVDPGAGAVTDQPEFGRRGVERTFEGEVDPIGFFEDEGAGAAGGDAGSAEADFESGFEGVLVRVDGAVGGRHGFEGFHAEPRLAIAGEHGAKEHVG